MTARSSLPADTTVVAQVDELAAALRRCTPTAPPLALRMIDRLGIVPALVAMGDTDPRIASKLRLALAASWMRNGWQRHRFGAAARGDRWAAIEVLGEVSDSIPRRPGRYGPDVIAMPARRPTCVRRPPRRARSRGRRDRRTGTRSSRAGPDSDPGDADPPSAASTAGSAVRRRS